jgi:hypothetical protein
MSIVIKVIFLFMLVTSITISQSHQNVEAISFNSMERLELINVKVKAVFLNEMEGIRVERIDGLDKSERSETLVLIDDVFFKDGIIELEIAGEPAPDAGKGAKGFVGVAFRIDSTDYSNYECIYLRPVNGRADNQLQRNHSVQYISHPEYPWQRLRKEQSGVYESYVDLIAGEWTSIKIVVSEESARLYVHGNLQPSLIVNDLKHGDREGMIGLWLHRSTIAHYRNIKITTIN